MAETISTTDRSGNLAATPLLNTKLFIPQARQLQDILPRPRLVERLQTGLSGRLTLISAPAGFGKTTLLTEWIPHSDRCVCWLSLDEADNDLARFLTYVIAALQGLRVDFGQTLLVALQTPQPPAVEALMTALVNEITHTLAEFALVLDDYHLIELSAIHTALTFLLNNLPPNMHLILTSRADPPLPLARLRARRHVSEIRAADLRFTPDEAATFLNEIMSLNLSAADITALETRTEGWVAGLQLAALSIQGRQDVAGFIRAFSGSHRHVLSYLVEEVLNQCPAGTLVFLLQTSILDRLSAPLCDAVTGRNDSQQMLEQIEAANLFLIPLDDVGQWYRYHHLFAEVLRQRLQRSLSTEAVAELHRRASTWCKQAKLIDEAIHHALAGQAFDRATTLVEQAAPAMIQHGEFAQLRIWLEILPEEEIQDRPLLRLYYVWVLYISGQINQAAAHLEAVEAMLEADEAKRTPEIQGLIAAVQARLLRDAGDLAATIALSRQALANLPAQAVLLRTRITLNLAIAHYLQGEFGPASQLLTETMTFGHMTQLLVSLPAIYLKAQLLRAQGRLQQALQLCEEGLELVARHKWQDFPAVGFLWVAMGDLLRERNELSVAGEYLERGVRLGQAGGHHHILIIGQVWLAWLRQTEGNATGSQEAIRAALQLVQQYEVSRFWPLPSAACTQTRLWIAQGNLAAASHWVQTSGLDQGMNMIPYLDEAAYLTLIRLRMAEGSLEVAEALLLWLHQAAASAGRSGSLIEILILQAVTYAAQKQSEKAMSVLAQALNLAEPEGYIRLFVDEGKPVAELLRRMTALGEGERRKDYIHKLLLAFETNESGINPTGSSLHPSSFSLQPLVEPLSVREQEILHLVAEGLSNNQIATHLIITTGTVKTHLNRIFGKLGVQSRTQAIVRGRELGLIAS